jgi:hypothetical protein
VQFQADAVGGGAGITAPGGGLRFRADKLFFLVVGWQASGVNETPEVFLWIRRPS